MPRLIIDADFSAISRNEFESTTDPGTWNPLLDIAFVLDEGTAGEKWMIEDHRGGSAVYTFNEIGFSSHDDDIDYIVDNINVTHTPIPEPATIALLGMGVIGALLKRKRSHRVPCTLRF